MNSNKLQYPCMIKQEKLPMRKIIRQFIFFEKNTTQATPQKANEHLCSTMGKWMALRMAHFMHAFRSCGGTGGTGGACELVYEVVSTFVNLSKNKQHKRQQF